MRSAVQSCVPLQESTAHRCVFFVYGHQAAPKGLDIGIYGAESLLSKRQKWRWTARERSDRRPDRVGNQKCHSDSPPCFLGYHATGHEGLEGAHRATETSCVPLLENQPEIDKCPILDQFCSVSIFSLHRKSKHPSTLKSS